MAQRSIIVLRSIFWPWVIDSLSHFFFFFVSPSALFRIIHILFSNDFHSTLHLIEFPETSVATYNIPIFMTKPQGIFHPMDDNQLCI